jgi:hypothetical protein
MKRWWWAAGLLAALPAAACPLPSPMLQAGSLQAEWKADSDAPVGVGQHFVLNVRLCPADAVLLRVNAVMPEHGHGMNYRPSVTRLPDGHWRVEGLLFQMPGSWELRLDVRMADRTERLRQTIDVP